MRIALIQAPIEDFYSTVQRTYPLGLTYLAGALNGLPVEINIVDFITGHGRQTIPIPSTFKAIRPYISYDHSPISVFHTYYHWGASWEYIRQYFSEEHYDLCAISSNFYTYSQEVITLAGIIKSASP
ncbi:MAG: B12-binding domain-containing radical SAM protein, partial [Candidatus Marinimicrobia bacterium]|nr:B12-binding domain-containing radical SAM protein [Candidatus Neomarinimicrobiota bacterium]